MGKTGLPVSDSWMSMPAEEERGLRGLQVRGLQVRGSAGVYVHGVYSCVAGKGGSPVPAITQDYSLPPVSAACLTAACLCRLFSPPATHLTPWLGHITHLTP